MKRRRTKHDVELIYRWPSILEEAIANAIQSEINTVSIPTQEIDLAFNLLPTQDAGIQNLVEDTDQLERRTNNNLTDPTLPGASTTSHFPPSGAPPTHSNNLPTIRPEHQPYVCSWHHPGSDTQCNHVAPNRSTLLRHLGEKHQVSGAPDVSIVCQLLDSKTHSACNTPIQRRNFPRHADIHYSVRYLCQHCPANKSFSRQDSWWKHIRTMHAQVPPAS
ncbi:hypothetical protein J3R82DRAFT_3192 [Butyriboletus roseoflavus]|nr:hypothetical protein J3R82DRAFT_3192 [Butyriboletus roseoflavus]